MLCCQALDQFHLVGRHEHLPVGVAENEKGSRGSLRVGDDLRLQLHVGERFLRPSLQPLRMLLLMAEMLLHDLLEVVIELPLLHLELLELSAQALLHDAVCLFHELLTSLDYSLLLRGIPALRLLGLDLFLEPPLNLVNLGSLTIAVAHVVSLPLARVLERLRDLFQFHLQCLLPLLKLLQLLVNGIARIAHVLDLHLDAVLGLLQLALQVLLPLPRSQHRALQAHDVRLDLLGDETDLPLPRGQGVLPVRLGILEVPADRLVGAQEIGGRGEAALVPVILALAAARIRGLELLDLLPEALGPEGQVFALAVEGLLVGVRLHRADDADDPSGVALAEQSVLRHGQLQHLGPEANGAGERLGEEHIEACHGRRFVVRGGRLRVQHAQGRLGGDDLDRDLEGAAAEEHLLEADLPLALLCAVAVLAGHLLQPRPVQLGDGLRGLGCSRPLFELSLQVACFRDPAQL